MKLGEISPGRWYATTLGIGECTGFRRGPNFKQEMVKVRIDGLERLVASRDVYGEAKKPEVAS